MAVVAKAHFGVPQTGRCDAAHDDAVDEQQAGVSLSVTDHCSNVEAPCAHTHVYMIAGAHGGGGDCTLYEKPPSRNIAFAQR